MAVEGPHLQNRTGGSRPTAEGLTIPKEICGPRKKGSREKGVESCHGGTSHTWAIWARKDSEHRARLHMRVGPTDRDFRARKSLIFLDGGGTAAEGAR